MKHGIGKCRVCDNYLPGVDTCKFCSFEWRTDYPPTIDVPYDIFEADDDVEWSHLQLLDRLHFKGIDCWSADIWFDNNLAYLWGCKGSKSDVALALHVHEEVIYDDVEHGFMIINLFQEKYLRGMLE
jgi:hypothetical protein